MRTNHLRSNGPLSFFIAILSALPNMSLALVGEPYAAGPNQTFSIKIFQGDKTIVDSPRTKFPLKTKTDPVDEPVEIGKTECGTPVILKVQSDGKAHEPMRILHWHFSTPVSLEMVDTPSLCSLLDPRSRAYVKVEISQISFRDTALVSPMIPWSPSFYVSYLFDSFGRFYDVFASNAYNSRGNGKVDVQVSSHHYLDANFSTYDFKANSGAIVSWKWTGVVPPGLKTSVVGNHGPLPSDYGAHAPGHVFELGLAVAFVRQ